MHSDDLPSRFRLNVLLAVRAGVVTFGLVPVIAPCLARPGFSHPVHAAPERIDAFGEGPGGAAGHAPHRRSRLGTHVR